MPRVPVIENPRRRRRRSRHLSPAQIAAGFGGKRGVRHRRKAGRRRNPALAQLALNPRRRSSRHRYAIPRRHRRHSFRNPLGATHIGPFQFDLVSAAWVGGGMILSKQAPSLIQKVWPGVPTTGMAGYGVRLGAVLLAGYGVKMVTKSPQRSGQLVAGGLGMVLFDLFSEYVAPKIGLSGLSNDRLITQGELDNILAGTGGYVPSPMAGFVTTSDAEMGF
jgi:hypothetical protein